jgi:hypothetical protein
LWKQVLALDLPRKMQGLRVRLEERQVEEEHDEQLPRVFPQFNLSSFPLWYS